MPFMQATIKYGFSTLDFYTHKMLFWGGDNSDHTGGSGGIDVPSLTVPADQAPMLYLENYVRNYLVCLQEVVQPGVQILECFGEQFDATDWSAHTIQYTATWDVSVFTPASGNLSAGGPRGRDFIAARQRISSTNRNGWLRFHYVARNHLAKPTSLLPGDISTKFANWYPNLRNLASTLGSYATVTNAITAAPIVVTKELPATTLRQGIRNG